MKNIIIIASLLLGMPLMAQTKVVKKNAVKQIISDHLLVAQDLASRRRRSDESNL